MLLKLQPVNFFSRRCSTHPFVIGSVGHLEGELQARGLLTPNDPRRLIRKLKSQIEEPAAPGSKRLLRVSQFTGLPTQLVEVFTRLQSDSMAPRWHQGTIAQRAVKK